MCEALTFIDWDNFFFISFLRNRLPNDYKRSNETRLSVFLQTIKISVELQSWWLCPSLTISSCFCRFFFFYLNATIQDVVVYIYIYITRVSTPVCVKNCLVKRLLNSHRLSTCYVRISCRLTGVVQTRRYHNNNNILLLYTTRSLRTTAAAYSTGWRTWTLFARANVIHIQDRVTSVTHTHRRIN